VTERPVSLVTGAAGAIGKAIAFGLASRGHRVIVVCRQAGQAARVAGEIAERTGNHDLQPEAADLGRRSEIRALAARLPPRLDVLVNNAATAPRRRALTAEGIEVQLATNILGYFWMIRELEARLASSAPSRVVNVASYWAGGLDLDDLGFERRAYDNDSAYRQSKQADRMLSAAFAARLAPSTISVNSCHPGDVSSKLSKSLGFGGHETAEDAAETPLWLALDDVGRQVSGRYFEHMRETPCRFSGDHDAVEALYRACERF
jgi:NAD(P)-dependent dehydrogenase (short-subunit alcohol dehydrogenase family)